LGQNQREHCKPYHQEEWTPRGDNPANLRANRAFRRMLILTHRTKAVETTMGTKKRTVKMVAKKIPSMLTPGLRLSNKSASKPKARTLTTRETSRQGSTCGLPALVEIPLTKRIHLIITSWRALTTGLSIQITSHEKKGHEI